MVWILFLYFLCGIGIAALYDGWSQKYINKKCNNITWFFISAFGIPFAAICGTIFMVSVTCVLLIDLIYESKRTENKKKISEIKDRIGNILDDSEKDTCENCVNLIGEYCSLLYIKKNDKPCKWFTEKD